MKELLECLFILEPTWLRVLILVSEGLHCPHFPFYGQVSEWNECNLSSSGLCTSFVKRQLFSDCNALQANSKQAQKFINMCNCLTR